MIASCTTTTLLESSAAFKARKLTGVAIATPRAQQHGLQLRSRQFRQLDESEPTGCGASGTAVGDRIGKSRRLGDDRQHHFKAGHKIVPGWPQVAAVVGLEEARAEGRHVHLDGALSDARLAGEAPIHCVLDLQRKVAGTRSLPRVQRAGWQVPPSPRARAGRVHVLLREQRKPFAHRSQAFGRVFSIARRFPRRTHRVIGVVVEAGGVAVAVERIRIGVANCNGNTAIELAPRRHFVQAGELLPGRRGDLSRIELVVRIERRLYFLNSRIERSEEFRRVLGAVALAMLAPENALVFAGAPPRSSGAPRAGLQRPASREHQRLHDAHVGGRRAPSPHAQGRYLAGPALTVKTRPGDNLMIHKALTMAQPGDVIVVDAGGDLTNSLFGEIMVATAVRIGVAGVVLNGAVRDCEEIGEGTLPLYAAGVTHRGPYKDGPGEINVPIAIDGMVIHPGAFSASPGQRRSASRRWESARCRRTAETWSSREPPPSKTFR